MSGYFATWQANLLSRGWTIQELALLVSVSLTLGLVLDVPFGVFADRIGNKKTVVAAFVVFALGFLLPSVSALPLALASCVVSVSVGNALLNGALDSWSADLQSHGSKDISTTFYLGLDQLQRVGMILGALIVPFVTSRLSHDSPLIWGIYSILSMLVLWVVFLIPNVKHQIDPSHESTKFSALLNPKVFILICGFLFFGFSDGVVQVAFWPKILSSGVQTLFGLGLIQAGMSAARFLGGELWKRTRFIESDRAPTIALVLSAIPYYFFAQTATPMASGALWLLRVFLLSLYFPSVAKALQHAFKGAENRVAFISLMSTVGVLGAIAVTSAVGFVSGVEVTALIYFGAASSVIAGLFFARFARS